MEHQPSHHIHTDNVVHTIKAKLKHWWRYLKTHRFVAAIVLLLILGGGYYAYASLFTTEEEARYVVAEASYGDITSVVSGSGQVSATNQIDLKPDASGTVVYIGVVPGQKVGQSALVLQIDSRDAERGLRDAEVNLESAKLQLEKLQKPADALSLIQAENALAKAEEDLIKAYDDAFTDVSDAYIDLPNVVTALEGALYNNDFSTGQDNYAYVSDAVGSYDDAVRVAREDALAKYVSMRKRYDSALALYKSASRTDTRAEIEKLVSDTVVAIQDVADTAKSIANFYDVVDGVYDVRELTAPATLATIIADVAENSSTVNAHFSNAYAASTAITNGKRTLDEKEESLADLRAGSDEIDIRAQELAVLQRENALKDAKEELADYYVRAPFAGTIATVDAKKANSVTSGTVVATLITEEKIAEVSLNEVDVADVDVGQAATLTFDAISDLEVTGEVVEVDTLGTEVSGAVNYTVKIRFDAQEPRIRTGMTVSAEITTSSNQNTLIIPSSAVRTGEDGKYVEVIRGAFSRRDVMEGIPVSSATPERISIQTGVASDTMIEILSGLAEGDIVITRSNNGTGQVEQSAPSIFGGGGGVRVGGGTR